MNPVLLLRVVSMPDTWPSVDGLWRRIGTPLAWAAILAIAGGVLLILRRRGFATASRR